MEDRQPRADTASGKRPYEAPTVRSETIFETTALACAKASNNTMCTLMGVSAS
jgi:hypothetical protein